ncbi:MAG: YbhB/YbcL family Raf kinase inhibitor-like protein [Acidobacteriaceae bacterium]
MANQRRRTRWTVCAAAALGLMTATSWGQQEFRLNSAEFSNDSTLPLSTILNNQVNGVNTCTANGAAGYDESPELSWSGAPRGTRSFVVVLYDVTASFTHWGMYNIAGDVTRLPENAGVAGSSFGTQIENDFDLGQQYDGPCPPAGVAPDTHKYVFKVYALSTTLDLPGSANFPANGETLYHALIYAGEHGEILGKASLVGLYSSTPPAQ